MRSAQGVPRAYCPTCSTNSNENGMQMKSRCLLVFAVTAWRRYSRHPTSRDASASAWSRWSAATCVARVAANRLANTSRRGKRGTRRRFHGRRRYGASVSAHRRHREIVGLHGSWRECPPSHSRAHGYGGAAGDSQVPPCRQVETFTPGWPCGIHCAVQCNLPGAASDV